MKVKIELSVTESTLPDGRVQIVLTNPIMGQIVARYVASSAAVATDAIKQHGYEMTEQ